MLTDPFAKFSEDVGAVFRPQREWVEGRGLYLISAFFFSGVGAGAWIFSTRALFDVPIGLMVGLVMLVVASGGAHLAFLGHPLRAWRMVARFRTSWVSRGIVGIVFFTGPAVLYLLPAYSSGLPWTQDSPFGRAMMVLSITAALWVAAYKGFVFAAAKGIPFWNSPILPPLFIAYALRGGLAVVLLIAAFGGRVSGLHAVETVKLWTVASGAALVLSYIWVMSEAGMAARRSVREMLHGRASLAFYLGMLAAGIVVPIVGGSMAFFTELSRAAIALIGACSLVGDFYATYCIAKAGIYVPILVGGLSQESRLEAR